MGQAHFDSKWEIERYIQSEGLPFTILRPVFFTENFGWQRTGILDGTLTGLGLSPDKGLQMIAVDDVGAFAALALAHPQDYGGKILEMAGDELTEPQIAATFSEVIGRPVKLASPSPPRTRSPPPRRLPCSSSSAAKATTPTSRRSARSIQAYGRWSGGCARTDGKTLQPTQRHRVGSECGLVYSHLT
jgi:nucleoside-diphosphate-sugar epimerase